MITKWTASEIADDRALIRDVENSNIRQCSYCGAYVRVEDQAGEHEFKNGKSANDICDDCVDCIEEGKEIEIFEDDRYEDYLEDENEGIDEEE